MPLRLQRPQAMPDEVRLDQADQGDWIGRWGGGGCVHDPTVRGSWERMYAGSMPDVYGMPAMVARSGKRHRIAHRTVKASFWRAATATVWVAGREHTLVVAVNESTAEVKYFLTNATA